ncbi:polysaccharide deacetylase family protein [Methylophaga sp.]|uniref:polysaccharide deacetylase family protein n=1 Tax=Methylophaga sp. TaxID=2024840 RepID=UPI002719B505|nr:polysaccharide deacetylase family protein [Methylophaga sp.]MDO8825874.1 polysaccharide deacetylase family protein [Methylophaga sp.]
MFNTESANKTVIWGVYQYGMYRSTVRSAMQIKTFVSFSLIALMVMAVLGFKVMNSRDFQLFGKIVSQVTTDDRVVALTLDDGPSIQYTDEVLKILNEYDVKATFFVVGQETHRFKEQAKSIVQHGHELGNHSYTHPRMVFKTLSTIRQEIEKTDEAIRAVGYQGDIHFRAPYTKKLLILPWYLASTNRLNISWSVGPDSRKNSKLPKDPNTMTQYVLENIQPGSIILLHVMYENGEASRQALPMIIEAVKAKGYRFVTISELLQHD